MKRKLVALISAILLFPGVISATAYSSQDFTDVPSTFWAYEPIMEMADAGIINGTGEGVFSPSLTVSAAQFLTLVGRVAFPEIETDPGESWYGPYVAAAQNAGWLNGTSIDPSNPTEGGVTRYDMAVVLSKAGEKLGSVAGTINIGEIKDYDQVPENYKPFVKTVYGQGLIKGDANGNFSGANTMTRAEVAMVIWRLLKLAGTPGMPSEPIGSKLNAEQISIKCAPATFYVDIYGFNGDISGSGSGFFISADGLAITNFHVAANSSLLVITTQDGKKYSDVTIIDCDEKNDLALLRINGGPFPYLEFGDSSAVRQGQTVYAIGSPLGLTNTLSTGIISNPLRVLDDTTYIQISVPIAPGSSGGALIDEQGKVIGVTSAGFSNSTGDLNLAVPSNFAAQLNRSSTDDLILWQEKFYPDSSDIYDFGAFSGVKRISAFPYAYGWVYTYDAFDFHDGDGSLDPAERYAYSCLYYRKALLDRGFQQVEEDDTEMGGIFETEDEIVGISIDLSEERVIKIITYRIPQYYRDMPTLPDFGWYTFMDCAEEGPYKGSFMYKYIWPDYYSTDAFYMLLELYFDLLEEEGYTKEYDDGNNVLYAGNGVSVVFSIRETALWIDAKAIDTSRFGETPGNDEGKSLPSANRIDFPWYLYSKHRKTISG